MEFLTELYIDNFSGNLKGFIFGVFMTVYY